ncbi:2-nitropropane dioxygenase [bacterium]|nr:2-nitropropane dioxygenase [bacterium]
MTWVSERNLVSAISNAGGFGVIASGSMPPELLRTEIRETRKLTSKPFGVNLIVLHPQLDELVQVCIEEKVTHVVFAGGLPKKPHIDQLKEAGVKSIAFAPALIIAKRLVKMGVDALVIEGSEAGGHIGPVSTAVLAQEILPNITEVPVFVAGGIGRGETMAAFLEMGAAGVQMGTRFVCAEECVAHPRFKEAFIRASARDATVTVQLHPEFTVIPVRALENDGKKEFNEYQRKTIERWQHGEVTKEQAQLDIEHFWAGSLRRAVVEGDVERGSVMAGQSVGMVTTIQPVAAIIAELVGQATQFLNKSYEVQPLAFV